MGNDYSDLLPKDSEKDGEAKADVSNGGGDGCGKDGIELKRRTDLLLVADTPKGK